MRQYVCDECKEPIEGKVWRHLSGHGVKFAPFFKIHHGGSEYVRGIARGELDFHEQCLKEHLQAFTEEICGYPVEEPAALSGPCPVNAELLEAAKAVTQDELRYQWACSLGADSQQHKLWRHLKAAIESAEKGQA